MGKGYNNYMCKKPFHPGSKANIKRSWMAEQRTENEKKKQEDLRLQYEKEQDLYNNKALLSTESKDKLELNFMYEAPPGAKRERQKEDDEPEYKFEWQRKYNAPREDFAKGNKEIRDQPFGIPVRNVRCIKCHKWGHINTDKECPLYSQASTSSMPTTSMDPLELMRQMREDGFNLKQSVLGHHLNPQEANQQLIASDDEDDPEMQFLKNLSTKQKHKLLKKLNKLAKKQGGKESKGSKKKKSKKSSKVKGQSNLKSKVKGKHNSDSESDSEEKMDQRHKKKKKVVEYSPESNSSSKSTGAKSSASEQSEVEQNKLSTSRRISTSKTAVSMSSKCKKTELARESEKCKNLVDEGDMPDLNVKQKSDPESATTSAYVNESPERCSPKHPDWYDCDMTQPAAEDNIGLNLANMQPQEMELKDSERYRGHIDDRFRNKHRHRRSPSIKQKYKSI